MSLMGRRRYCSMSKNVTDRTKTLLLNVKNGTDRTKTSLQMSTYILTTILQYQYFIKWSRLETFINIRGCLIVTIRPIAWSIVVRRSWYISAVHTVGAVTIGVGRACHLKTTLLCYDYWREKSMVHFHTVGAVTIKVNSSTMWSVCTAAMRITSIMYLHR